VRCRCPVILSGTRVGTEDPFSSAVVSCDSSCSLSFRQAHEAAVKSISGRAGSGPSGRPSCTLCKPHSSTAADFSCNQASFETWGNRQVRQVSAEGPVDLAKGVESPRLLGIERSSPRFGTRSLWLSCRGRKGSIDRTLDTSNHQVS